VGIDLLEIPAHRYAAFTHPVHIGDMAKVIYTIWNQALPGTGPRPAPAPELERHDERVDVETGLGVVEVWIPVG